MLAGLVTWAQEQPKTPQLRRDVIARWSELTRTHGIELIRFLTANPQLHHEVKQKNNSGHETFLAIFELFGDAGAPLEKQIRGRMAALSIHFAAMAAKDLDADTDQILSAAQHIALELLEKNEADD